MGVYYFIKGISKLSAKQQEIFEKYFIFIVECWKLIDRGTFVFYLQKYLENIENLGYLFEQN